MDGVVGENAAGLEAELSLFQNRVYVASEWECGRSVGRESFVCVRHGIESTIPPAQSIKVAIGTNQHD